MQRDIRDHRTCGKPKELAAQLRPVQSALASDHTPWIRELYTSADSNLAMARQAGGLSWKEGESRPSLSDIDIDTSRLLRVHPGA